MRGKILLLVGLGVGYVLGSRAGRERYNEISRAANKLWNDPRVQKQVNQAEDFVKDKAPEVAEFFTDGARKVVSQVSGSKPGTSKSGASKSSAAKPASGGATASRSTTKKS